MLPSAAPPPSASALACPVCAGMLAAGSRGAGAPQELGGWPLAHCPACGHTCCPAAFSVEADYEELYGTDYLTQQIAPLRDPRQHAALALLPPYLAFSRLLGPGRGRRLLDVGAGAGRFLLVAQRAGWQAQGIEPAARAVSAARDSGLWLPLSSRTPQELADAGQRFDAVTLFDVLEHVAAPRQLLASVLPLLAPGGSLFITVPNWDCALMQQAVRADWLPPVHLQFFSAQSLAACVAALGSPLRLRGQGAVLTDPQPPLAAPALAWLRWASRRLRGQTVHAAQLWLLARLPSAPTVARQTPVADDLREGNAADD